MRHVNIPIFIPHLGCPNQCVFCNQRTISGVEEFNASEVKDIIEEALATIENDALVEIAFFGGSFTGIDRELMVDLLKTANDYIKRGRVDSIRCSTRPDYISPEILDILKQYNVRHVELGLQSSSDYVLRATKRGHSREDERRACELIRSYGFGLTGQMMIGLPASTPELEMETAEFIISAGCDSARIYPTVVFKDTELCHMAQSGVYEPLTLESAVVRSAAVLERFIDADIDVLRIGLCATENLSSEDTYFAGPNHSALGELVINQVYYRKIYREVDKLQLCADDCLVVEISRSSLSKAVGQKKRNKLLLKEKLGIREVRFVESDILTGYEVRLSVEERGK